VDDDVVVAALSNIAQKALTVNPGRIFFGEAYLYVETTASFTRRFLK
jgi:hypothetical protein